MDQHTYTVTELTDRVGATLGRAFPDEIWVQGEIRDLSRSRNGHVYFSLVDAGTEGQEAVLPVTLFASERFVVNRVLVKSGAGRMTDGVNVRIRGRLGLYAQRGTIQLRMSWIDTDYTLGQLAAERKALIQKLTGDGSLVKNGLLQMPMLPLEVGLVTSTGSAAHADFLTELQRSGYGFRVVVSHATVQGVDAPESIADALTRLAGRPISVVAMVRGGGAQTDLATFDTEAVARAISRCAVPVLTGIGHETDQTVADLAAHAAYKTPTATAQALVGAVRRYADRLERVSDGVGRAHRTVMQRAGGRVDHSAMRLRTTTGRHLERKRLDLERLSGGIHGAARQTGAASIHRVDQIAERSLRAVRHRLATADADLTQRTDLAVVAIRRAVADVGHRLDLVEASVHGRDPVAMFARGWSITYGPDGLAVRDPGQVSVDERLRTVVEGGTLTSVVIEPGGDG